MFDRIGRVVTRRPVLVVVTWVLLVALAGTAALWGFGQGGLFDQMKTSDFVVPGSQSEKVSELTSGNGSDDSGTTSTVVVSGLDLAAEPAAVAEFVDGHRSLLEVRGVDSVVDPFALPDPTSQEARALMSTAGDGYVAVVALVDEPGTEAGDAAQAALAGAVDSYRDALRDQFPGAEVEQVSEHVISEAILDQVRHDLVAGELVGLPVALLIMVIVFGGLLAAGMPLLAAVCAIAVGTGALWVATFATGIDSFILNVISIIGVALSIDYGLLVVSRFREETKGLGPGAGGAVPGGLGGAQGGAGDGTTGGAGRSVGSAPGRDAIAAAVRRSVATAGRTVTFSAVTIAFAMVGLLVMRTHVLRTIGFGGMLVTLLALLASVTLVPALLTLLGGRILRPSPVTRVPGLRRVVAAVGDSSGDDGFFSRLARSVHARPWWVMGASALVLVAMALPLKGLELRNNFTDYIPTGTQLRAAFDTVQADYPALAVPSVQAVADMPVNGTQDLVEQVRDIPGVEDVRVAELGSDPSMSVLDVRVDASDPVGEEVTDVMLAMRDLDPGHGWWVGGGAALQHDFTHALVQDAPGALAVVAAAVLVLLFLMTGSLLVPVKALIINSLSLLASLGLTTLVFEHGLFGVPRTQGLETFIVACMVAFGFGLAMDYEVFLLARIKEYWDQGLDNDTAVERGLQRSGRIITSAAAIIIAVFIGFTAGQMLAIKQIGVALAIMVATDATLTRLLLVPATMTLLGRWNWWAPAPLRRLHERFGLHE
ncbi:MMPL family transporter [Actinomyces provencensis]|uniref:MMPL family transporter n=1 Tax=Actinomyces provencensis TaxID=1720198 RepID=UPI00096A56B9|nr:MMPL family transporter [Actinomyces provencensis]